MISWHSHNKLSCRLLLFIMLPFQQDILCWNCSCLQIILNFTLLLCFKFHFHVVVIVYSHMFSISDLGEDRSFEWHVKVGLIIFEMVMTALYQLRLTVKLIFSCATLKLMQYLQVYRAVLVVTFIL